MAVKESYVSVKEAIDCNSRIYFTSNILTLADLWGSGEDKIIFGNKSKDFVEFPIKFKKILWKNQ